MKKALILLVLIFFLPVLFSTNLPYWIEHDENGNILTNAKIWTKVNLSSTRATNFYVYYGGDTSFSNGSAVFDFFDDFDYTPFGSWSKTDNLGAFQYHSTVWVAEYNGNGNQRIYHSVSSFSCARVLLREIHHGVDAWEAGLEISTDLANGYQLYLNPNNLILRREVNDGEATLSATPILPYEYWGVLSLSVCGGNLFGKFRLDNGGVYTVHSSDTTFGSFSQLQLWMDIEDLQCAQFDWVSLAKYDPSLSLSINYGQEEAGSWTIDGHTYTKRRLITVSSNKDETDYQVALDYSYFNNPNLLFLDQPSKQISITNATPPQGFLTQNKTITFNYTIEFQTDDLNENASVELYLDDVLIANDTVQNGTTTITHTINTTYGQHNYTIKAYSQNDTSVYDELTRTFEVFFNITAITPEPNIMLVGNTTIFEINTTNLYPIYCEYYIDTLLVANETYNTAGTYNITQAITNGTHTWQVKCYAGDNTNYTKQTDIITFHQNYVSFENEIQIPVFANVIATHQRIFFDNEHNLWLLFFVDYEPNDYVYLVKIKNNTVEKVLSDVMNVDDLADFFVFFPNENSFDLFTFSKNGSKYYLIRVFNNETNSSSNALQVSEYNTSAITGWSSSITYIFPNSYYDPWSYVNLPENYTLTDSSFYLFDVKVNTTDGERIIYLAKKPDNDTLSIVKWGAVYSASYWSVAPIQTAPLTNDLTTWIAPYYEKSGNNRPYIRIAEVKNNGTSWAFKQSTCDFSEGRNLISTFGRSKKFLFLVLNNASCYSTSSNNFYIYEATSNTLFSKKRDPAENSFIIFSSDDTFNIFETNTTISVYFNGSVFNVSEISYNDYGVYVPYRRGEMTTRDTENNIDRIVKGKAILQQDGIYLLYTDHFYDAKFITYDEQEEYRKPFKILIYTNNSISYRTENEVWGYTIPSELIGGLKNVYITGHNGTKRLYIVGLNENYLLEAWSLNQDQGFFCTFNIYNQFQIPIPNARISALRYSNLKKSWVIVEQSITNLQGIGYLFLEPFTLYKIRVEGDNYITMEFDYTPVGTPCQVDVKLNTNGSVIQPMPDYHTLFEDISYSLQPEENTFFKQPFNITFTISSASGKLEWANMVIVREFNHTKTTVYNSTITSPTGGILQYTANETGKYYVFTSFKHEDYEEYTFYPKTYWLGLNAGLTKAMEQLNENTISGWSWFFFSLIVAILVAGFVAQYTVEGAGLMGLVALWILTLLYPSGVVVCLGNGICITTLTATILLTLLVGGGLLATKYL